MVDRMADALQVTLGNHRAEDYLHGETVLHCLNQSIDCWCAETGKSRKELAARLGISDAQFSRVTTGVQAFGLAMLAKLPRVVRLDFYRRLRQTDAGEDTVTALAARLAQAAVDFLAHQKKRMARAGEAREMSNVEHG